MSNLNWQTSDGVTLKSLRQSAGIGLSVLARKASLSVDQLRQLEDGGSSLFYTEAIKLRAGERVLSILGFKFTEPQAQVKQHGSNEQRIVPVKAPKPDLLERLELAKNFALKFFKKKLHQLIFKFKKAYLLVLVNRIEVFRLAPKHPSTIKSLWHSTIFWYCAGTIASALLVYDLSLHSAQWGWGGGYSDLVAQVEGLSFKIVSVPAHSALVTESQVQSVKVDEPKVNNVPVIQAFDGGKSASLVTHSEPLSSNSVQQNPSSCHWQSAAPTITALHPNKQGNFVHIMATSLSSLCIMDSQNKVFTLTLASGGSQSVYGEPPFKIYSENLRGLKFYFQGYSIYVPEEVGKQISLTELPFTKEANVAQGIN